MKKIITLIIFILSVCLVGCGDSPIQVDMADPEKLGIGSETLDIRNCDSNDVMVTTMATHAPVRQHISISEQATLVKTGSAIDIPPDILDELRLQVETMYQPEYEEAADSAEKVEFTIPGHEIYMYKIQWIQQIYGSTISFSINRQLCTASYVYTLETPDLDSLTTMSCTA
jgi:hypothetical protein